MPDPAVRFVAFGDSTSRGPSDRPYPEILIERLGEKPSALAIESRGGEFTADGVERLRGLLNAGLFPNAHTLLYWEGGKDVLDFIARTDPLVVLSPADANYPFDDQLNATLDEVQANIESAIRTAQEAGLTVYVATYFLPPEALVPCEPLLLDRILPEQATRAGEYIRRLNAHIRQAAANTGATLVDVEREAPALSGNVLNFHDCNHLSAQGNAIVAEVFRAAIQE